MSEANFTRRCVVCGEIMEHVGNSRKYCDECRKMLDRERKLKARIEIGCKQYNAKGAAEMASNSSKKRVLAAIRKSAAASSAALVRDVEASKAAGLSYGQWRAMQEGRL